MISKNFIISKLFSIDAIKKGNFILKSGKESNIYCDMRVIISHPKIYNYLLLYAEIKYPDLFKNIDRIHGIDYGGIPFANFISFKKNIPQIHIRKEVKKYGTQKQIEGNYNDLENLLLVEDVITTGSSVQERFEIINNNNLKLSKILVIIDRREDFCSDLFNYSVYSLFNYKDIQEYINEQNKIIYSNNKSNLIYNLALQKKSNIILSCDFKDCEEILNIINILGNHIIGIKLHINIITNFNTEFIEKLLLLKKMYNLIIIEDGKFADIGNIVIHQLDGLYKIHKWADLITVHAITGEGIINSVKEIYPELDILLITELSSKNNLIDDRYTNSCLNMAMKNDLTGVVSQENIYKIKNKEEINILTFSPGININNTTDNFDQTYKKLDKNVNNGMFWIVGRGIYEGTNVLDNCIKYKELGWEHFKNY